MGSLLLKLSISVAYAALIVVNVGSNAGWWGEDNAEISAKYPTPLTPSGWTFAIWGVIFLLQGLGVVYSFVPSAADGVKSRALQDIGMNHPVMYVAYTLPTTINAAWLSVATSIGFLMTPALFNSPHSTVVAIVEAAVFGLQGCWNAVSRGDPAYSLTLMWALAGVMANDPSRAIWLSALLLLLANGAATVAAVALLLIRRRAAAQREWEETREALVAGSAPGSKL